MIPHQSSIPSSKLHIGYLSICFFVVVFAHAAENIRYLSWFICFIPAAAIAFYY